MNKIISLGTLAICLLLVLPIVNLLQKNNPMSGNSASLDWTGIVCPEVIRVDGTLERLECSHNAITTEGKNHIKVALGDNQVGATAFKYQAVGNGTATAVGDTVLNSEIADCGLARAAGTYVSHGDGNWSQTYQWTSTCNNLVVNTTGLFNHTAAGAADTILADADFSASVTLQSGDKLNVTYITWVS